MNNDQYHEMLDIFLKLYILVRRGNDELKDQLEEVYIQLEYKVDKDQELEDSLHDFNRLHAEIIKGANDKKDELLALSGLIIPELQERNRPIQGMLEMTNYVKQNQFPIVRGVIVDNLN